MKQQATQMMWFYDRQHEQWSLSDHLSCQPWQEEGAHPWARQLAKEDEAGFADFLARLHHSGQPGQFIGHLCDEAGTVHHVLWYGQYVPAQQLCCGWLAPLEMSHNAVSRAEPSAGITPPLPLLQAPLLAQLAQALSARTGLDFCHTLVNELAHILGANAVWLTERVGLDRLRVLASHGIDFKEYALADMPCQQLYRQGVTSSTPVSEPLIGCTCLPPGQHYYAQPLLDRSGQILGHLALLFPNQTQTADLGSVLTIFSVRMVAELERLQSDALMRLSAVAFETHEGIIITDPDFKILRVNYAFSQITGFDSQGVIGLHLGNDLWSGLGGLGYELNALDRWQGETLRLHADGHVYPQWEIVTPVQDDKGGISHYVIFFEDISERKAAERRIQDLAYYDELTGLPNRRQLHETLAQAFSEASREHLIGALLFIDLDHF